MACLCAILLCVVVFFAYGRADPPAAQCGQTPIDNPLEDRVGRCVTANPANGRSVERVRSGQTSTAVPINLPFRLRAVFFRQEMRHGKWEGGGQNGAVCRFLPTRYGTAKSEIGVVPCRFCKERYGEFSTLRRGSARNGIRATANHLLPLKMAL